MRRLFALFAVACTAAACTNPAEDSREDEVAWECGDEPRLLLPLAEGERAIVYALDERLLFDIVAGDQRQLRSTDRCGDDPVLIGVEMGRPTVLASDRVLACDGDAIVEVDPSGLAENIELHRGVQCDSAVDTPHGLLVSGPADGWVRSLILDGEELLSAAYAYELLPGRDTLLAVTGQAGIVRIDLATRASEWLVNGAVRIDVSPDGEAFVWQAFPGAGDVQPLYLYRDGKNQYLTEGYTPLSPPYDEVVWTADGEFVYVVGEFNDLIGLYDGTTGAPVAAPEHDFLGGDWPWGSRAGDGGLLLARVDGDLRTQLHWSPGSGDVAELWSDLTASAFNNYALDVGTGLVRLVRDDTFRIDGTLWHWSFDGSARELAAAGLYMSVVDDVVLTVVPDAGIGPVRAIDIASGEHVDLDDGAIAIPAPVAFEDFVVYQKPDGLWGAPFNR